MINNSILLTIPGEPIAKGRPRFTRLGRTYTNPKTKLGETKLRSAWEIKATNRSPHTGPITLTLISTFEPSKSWPQWKRDQALAGEWPHLIRPDFDNLAKIIDGLNGLAWVDDSQIISAQIRKQYGPEAKTEILIKFHPIPTKPRSIK
jgi:Holliday junction resolvase RusA-like endonuclease